MAVRNNLSCGQPKDRPNPISLHLEKWFLRRRI